ncbi:MAG: signal transduction histidine kinase [Cyclobacteriaceae bacterium]|jgi:signal transduction histidine kinase
MRTYISLFILLTFSLVWGQEHPLSKSDSGIINNSLKKYEFLIGEKDVRAASAALNDVAFVYWNNNHYASAAGMYEKSLALNEQVANENGIAMINNNLGMLYSDLGLYEKSLESFNKTLAARRSGKSSEGIIAAEFNMAVVLNNLKRYPESIVLLLEALDIARESYDKVQMRGAYGMLSETYEKMGEIDKSIQYFSLYKSFHEDIQKDEVKNINKVLEQEKLQKQAVEAVVVKKENELLRKEVENYQKDQEIQLKDSINQDLYENLSKNEIVIQLLENETKLNELEAASQMQLNEQLTRERNGVFIIFGIIIISLIIIVGLIFINARKTKIWASDLNDKKAELQKANDVKDRMFSIIAHDMRSPINSLQGFFSLIDAFELDEDVKGALNSVESQLTNSATLLENLLIWSKSQIENSEPVIGRVAVKELVDETFALLQLSAAKKKINLKSTINDSDEIDSDKAMLNIVIRNLIQNALKFTPAGGSISLSFENNGHGPLIKVQDTGIGMTEEKIKGLFDIQTNRSSVGTADEKGSGLGLILCKELIEKVDGKIEVTSEEGKGSVFQIKFNK